MIKYIILDTNVLIRYPEILSTKNPGIKLIIPTKVLHELTRSQSRLGDNSLFLGLKEAQEKGTVTITDVPTEWNEKTDLINKYRIDGPDIDILLYALSIKAANGSGVAIATQDKELLRAASENHIQPLTIQELVKEVKNTPTDSDVSEKIENHKNIAARGILINIITSVIVAFLTNITKNNFDTIVAYLPVWGTITAIVIFGIGLFVLREKMRLGYGIFEFIVGVSTTIWIFPSGFDYSKIEFDMDFGFKLLGGLYIMVRGQDNIIKGLQNRSFGLWIKEKTGIG